MVLCASLSIFEIFFSAAILCSHLGRQNCSDSCPTRSVRVATISKYCYSGKINQARKFGSDRTFTVKEDEDDGFVLCK